MQTPQTAPGPSRRSALATRLAGGWHLPAAPALVAAVTLLQLPALLSPYAGGYHDDGIYLVTARALATGDGYVIGSLPEPLAQTKYPVLFPTLLAGLWKVVPAFPANLPLLRLVPLLGMWAWMWLLWKLVGGELGRRRQAQWIIGLMLASPMTLYLGTQLLSETVFAAISTWAILLMVRIDRGSSEPDINSTLLLALACALAFHTRTIGITLLAPVALVFWRTKAGRGALVFAAAWAGMCAPWLIWQAVHSAPADAVLAYYTKANYGAWNLITGGEHAQLGRVAGFNVLLFMVMPTTLWGLPGVFGAPVLWLLLLVIAVWGTARMLRGPAAPAAAWVMGTVGLLLFWVWPPSRFLVPVMPFILLALLDRAGAFRARPARLAVHGMLAILVAAGFAQSILLARDTLLRDAPARYVRSGGAAATELLAAAAWIRANTSQDAVIAANLDPTYSLYGGRRALRAFAADPMTLFYTQDAPNRGLGDGEDMHHVLSAHGVTHLVFENIPIFRETEPLRRQITDFQTAWPGVLEEAWRSSAGEVVIYSVSW